MIAEKPEDRQPPNSSQFHIVALNDPDDHNAQPDDRSAGGGAAGEGQPAAAGRQANGSLTKAMDHQPKQAKGSLQQIGDPTRTNRLMIKELGGRRTYTLDHSLDGGSGGGKNPAASGYVRHIVAILALSSIVLANMNRQAYNQSLSAMIRPPPPPPAVAANQSAHDGDLHETTTTIYGDNAATEFDGITTTTTTTTTTTPPVESASIDRRDADGDKFEWDQKRVSLLQSAFSYGYTPFMIPGGRLSEIYGAKWIVFASGFGSALCSALTPFLADYNFYLLVGSRILMGICQTGVSPALYALLTRWLPAEESNVYLPMMKVGVMIGFMLGSSISGFFQWRTTFHLVALISFAWSMAWLFFISSDPSEHRFIATPELKYIQAQIRLNNRGRKMSLGAARRRTAPWFNILTNPVVLAFMFAKFTVKLSTDAQTIQVPKYLNDVFRVSQELNGLLNSLNYAIQALFTGFVAWSAKECIQRQVMGKTQVRRLFQGICNFGMASAFILITFNMSSLAVVCAGIVLLSVASMFGAGGEAMTPVDLSSEYSASIMAIANSVANLSGIVLPPLVSAILGDQTTSAERWNMAWWTVGAIIATGGLAFVCRVEAELQDFRPEESAATASDHRRPKPTSAAAGARPSSQGAASVTMLEMTIKP